MLNNEGANDNHGGKASTMNMKKIERLKLQQINTIPKCQKKKKKKKKLGKNE